jgi:hypothetical protein
MNEGWWERRTRSRRPARAEPVGEVDPGLVWTFAIEGGGVAGRVPGVAFDADRRRLDLLTMLLVASSLWPTWTAQWRR